MSECWPLQLPQTAKAVLISLADNANDHGHCWPSIDLIAMRTCCNKRTVIRAIETLEQWGVLIADRSNGRHSKYQLTPDRYARPDAQKGADSVDNRCQGVTGDTESPVTLCPKPVTLCPKPVTESHSNHKNHKNRNTLTVSKPPDVSESVWRDWVALRKQKKAAVTETAVAGFRRKGEQAGMSLQAVLEAMCVGGWQGFDASWLPKQPAKPALRGVAI